MKLRITIEGKTYEVEVEVVEEAPAPPPAPPPARAIKPPPPARVSSTQGRRGVKDEKNARSPLAAVVVSVAVVAGQHVEKGDLLVVIEAMKMETRILAPAAGVVKAVHAAAGDAVKPGQILVELA